jgi:hypothetical protein
MLGNLALQGIKTAHTLVWFFLVLCILAIPVMSWRGDDGIAALFVVVVAVEVAVLAINQWHCPMTPLAARFTQSRRPNFDIYLPSWLARYNKQIFGVIYAACTLFALAMWLCRANPSVSSLLS